MIVPINGKVYSNKFQIRWPESGFLIRIPNKTGFGGRPRHFAKKDSLLQENFVAKNASLRHKSVFVNDSE